MIIIPIFKDESSQFIQEMDLNGVIYNLYIYWNSRDEAWYITVNDAETDEPIVAGMKFVPEYNMSKQYESYANMPQGVIAVLDLENDSVNSGITFENLYVRYMLVFFTLAEIESGIIEDSNGI